ncbi:hypothetical protein QTJ16_001600 [Diplocarpon rosae]|uniref:Uncharacterized protein n=1 Tax=Diplocarpon rosae TaxID=946125 RepID=A0AAD9T3P0_9HELO|nr:hypothetical protein QTJ16_001600 [Diplocarpon rosae]
MNPQILPTTRNFNSSVGEFAQPRFSHDSLSKATNRSRSCSVEISTRSIRRLGKDSATDQTAQTTTAAEEPGVDFKICSLRALQKSLVVMMMHEPLLVPSAPPTSWE